MALWDQIQTINHAAVRSTAFSPDGAFLAVVGFYASDGLGVISTSDWSLVTALTPPTDYNHSLTWSGDGEWLACHGNSVRVWNTSDWSVAATFNANTGNIQFSSDSSYLAEASSASGYEFDVYDTATWSLHAEAELDGEYDNQAHDISVSGANSLMAVAHNSGVTVFNEADWTVAKELNVGAYGEEPSVQAVAFDPNGDYLATLHEDDYGMARYSRVRLWNISDWSLSGEYEMGNQYIDPRDMCWANSGAWLVVDDGGYLDDGEGGRGYKVISRSLGLVTDLSKPTGGDATTPNLTADPMTTSPDGAYFASVDKRYEEIRVFDTNGNLGMIDQSVTVSVGQSADGHLTYHGDIEQDATLAVGSSGEVALDYGIGVATHANNRVSFWDVIDEVATYLGIAEQDYGGHFPKLRTIVRRGYRQFLWPQSTNAANGEYKWSFLEPVSLLPLRQEKESYRLPPGFSSLAGAFTFTDGSLRESDITVVGDSRYRKIKASSSLGPGTPQIVSIVPGELQANGGQFWQAKFYPTPDQGYVLEYSYTPVVPMPGGPDTTGTGSLSSITDDNLRMLYTADNPKFSDATSGDMLYLPETGIAFGGGVFEIDTVVSDTEVEIFAQTPEVSTQFELISKDEHLMGGETHEETIVESCLAVAETRQDDRASMHHQRYSQLLDSSVRRDQNKQSPATLGKLGKVSDPGGSSSQHPVWEDVKIDGESVIE